MLDAPQLAYLEFIGRIPEGSSTLKNLHSLVEARIDFEPSHEEFTSSNSIYKESATGFAQGLANVQSLYFSMYFTKVFSNLKIKFPTFLKLTKLECGIWDIFGCCLPQDLLESSPQLQTLILKFSNHFVPCENIPVCIWNRLKIVEQSRFGGNSKDLRFVEYILKNAKVLERFDLHSEGGLMSIEECLDATKKLVTFERASSSCKVFIYPV